MPRSKPFGGITAPTEHAEQVQVILWWRAVGCRRWHLPQHLLFAIPNGGHRSAATAALLSAEGVVAGVPDLMLAVTWVDPERGQWPGLWIELKRRKGGRVRQVQSDMHYHLAKQHYQVVVAYGADQAIAAITDYLTTLEAAGWPGGNGVFDVETGAYLPN